MLFATVPAAPPTRKNQRTTSCPAPISAKVPYQRGSRLIFSALEWVSVGSSFTEVRMIHLLNSLRRWKARKMSAAGLRLTRSTDSGQAPPPLQKMFRLTAETNRLAACAPQSFLDGATSQSANCDYARL